MNQSTIDLKGLRILNTRPYPQNLNLNHSIIQASGVPISFPTLLIEPTDHEWVKKMGDLSTLDQVIFISINAVEHFFSALQTQQIIWPSNIQVTTIGKGTAQSLKKWNIRVDNVPPIPNSEHLLSLPIFQNIAHQKVLLVKGEGGRDEIASTLMKLGAHLIPIEVYRRDVPKINQEMTRKLWHDNLVDIILFTSQQAIVNAFTLVGRAGRSWLCNTPCILISERLAGIAYELGIKHITVSPYDNLLLALEHYQQERI
jgi:uroporphyrinogen-III synthase